MRGFPGGSRPRKGQPVSPIASLFTLRGRTGRGGFWGAGLVQIAVGLALALAIGPTADFDWTNTSIADLLPWIAVAAVPAWIGFAATVRRWHDRDKSGWWCLVGALPLIGPVWLAVELGLSPGRPAPIASARRSARRPPGSETKRRRPTTAASTSSSPAGPRPPPAPLPPPRHPPSVPPRASR